MKQDICCITFVRNESIRLPVWLHHYRQFFNDNELYVIDQNTDDGSTDNLTCNIIYEPHEGVFAHTWLRQMLTKQLNKFLNLYHIVILIECDELIVTLDNQNLKDYLINKYKNCGHNVSMPLTDVIQLPKEIDYMLGDKISEIRNYFTGHSFKHTIHTCPSNELDNGFHHGNGQIDNNLISIHFQCLNIDFYKQKIISRINQKNKYGEGDKLLKCGWTSGCWESVYNEEYIDSQLNQLYKDAYQAPSWFKNNVYI